MLFPINKCTRKGKKMKKKTGEKKEMTNNSITAMMETTNRLFNLFLALLQVNFTTYTENKCHEHAVYTKPAVNNLLEKSHNCSNWKKTQSELQLC